MQDKINAHLVDVSSTLQIFLIIKDTVTRKINGWLQVYFSL